MSSAVGQHQENSSGDQTASRPGLDTTIPTVMDSCEQDPATRKESNSLSLFLVGQGEENGSCDKSRSMEELQCSQDGAADGQTCRICLDQWELFSPAHVLAMALTLAVTLPITVGLAVALAVQPAGRQGSSPAAVLACPEGWVGYRGLCYYLSKLEEEEGSWEWSRERCSALGALLAALSREWELEFLSRLKGKIDYWVGLRRRGEHLERVDGSSFNQTFRVQGQEPCFYLNNNFVTSSSCSLPRPYLCSKPQARL